jgi:hypothetical protein
MARRRGGGAIGIGMAAGLSKAQVVKLIDEGDPGSANHSHGNSAILSALSEDGSGKLTYNSQPVDTTVVGSPWLTSLQMLPEQTHTTTSINGDTITGGGVYEAKSPTGDFSARLTQFGWRIFKNGQVVREADSNSEDLYEPLVVTGKNSPRALSYTNVDVQVNALDVIRYNAAMVPGSFVTKDYLNNHTDSKRPVVTVAQANALVSPDVGDECFVLDDRGGSVPAFFDGIYWRRVTDRKTISTN